MRKSDESILVGLCPTCVLAVEVDAKGLLKLHKNREGNECEPTKGGRRIQRRFSGRPLRTRAENFIPFAEPG